MSDEEQNLGMSETLFHMALRHVIEGRERITRQEQVIADLERDGRDRLLPKAREVLDFLQANHAKAEADLALRRRLARKDSLDNSVTDLRDDK